MENKILFIGHYKDGNTGWSIGAKSLIDSMITAGLDVVPRAFKLNSFGGPYEQYILDLEKKSPLGCNICIQNVLPHHLSYNGNFDKNIAYCVYEIMNDETSGWHLYINQMDELWTANEYSAKCFRSMGVTIPIRVIPYGFDLSKYDKTYEKIEHDAINGNYIFYTIADNDRRKNLQTLIKAFHLSFNAHDNVRLLIKTSSFGIKAEELANHLKNECDKIKSEMKLYTDHNLYAEEIFVCDNLSDDELMRIHATGDCFVSASHGEGFCIPLFEACCMNKKTISSKFSGDLQSLVSAEIEGHYEPCIGMNKTFKNIASSRSSWGVINVKDLSDAMIKIRRNKTKVKNNMSYFSHSNVGNMIKKCLNSTLQ